MQVMEMHNEATFGIGSGNGWIRDQIRIASERMRAALTTISEAPKWVPGVEPHPREAALNAARESVMHLSEILNVEAPRDAIDETRHALEALQGTLSHLEAMPEQSTDLLLPGVGFQRAIGFLERVEMRLAGNPVAADGTTDSNSGIVPPWMGPDAPADGADTFIPLPGPDLSGPDGSAVNNGGIVPPWMGPDAPGGGDTFIPLPGFGTQVFVPEPGPKATEVFVPEPGPKAQVFVPEPGPKTETFIPEPGPK